MDGERLKKQVEFLVEIDKLKDVIREIYTINSKRKENTAEHTWHMTLMVPLLIEYAPKEADVSKMMKMSLIHDLVEVYAGDTFFYDESAQKDKGRKEKEASEKIFSFLPVDQALEFKKLWDEFEENSTPEAKFVKTLDKFHALLTNCYGKGKAWKEHGITKAKVISKMENSIKPVSEELWNYAEYLLNEGLKEGWLKEK